MTLKEYDMLFKRIVKLTTLTENWDSHGGLPTTTQAAQKAIQLFYDILFIIPSIDIIPVPQTVTLQSNGWITLEWGNKAKTLEIEINRESVCFYLKFESDPKIMDYSEANDSEQRGQLESPKQLKELFDWLAS
jgi:hypothetical protein